MVSSGHSLKVVLISYHSCHKPNTWPYTELYLVCSWVLLLEKLFFKKDFIYLFLERGEGREKESEGNINVWLPLTCPPLGTWPATQACALTGNRTINPLLCRLVLNPLSHTSLGLEKLLIMPSDWRYNGSPFLYGIVGFLKSSLQITNKQTIKIVIKFLLVSFFFLFMWLRIKE